MSPLPAFIDPTIFPFCARLQAEVGRLHDELIRKRGSAFRAWESATEYRGEFAAMTTLVRALPGMAPELRRDARRNGERHARLHLIHKSIPGIVQSRYFSLGPRSIAKPAPAVALPRRFRLVIGVSPEVAGAVEVEGEVRTLGAGEALVFDPSRTHVLRHALEAEWLLLGIDVLQAFYPGALDAPESGSSTH
jgi:hypothetical protein